MTVRKKSNPHIIETIAKLKERARNENAPIWRDIAARLERPRRNYAAVNLSRINRYTAKGDSVIVAGKVLSAGALDHPVTVSALDFSKEAERKIKGTDGKCLAIEELMKENPKGSGIKILE
jgi:large subunit ribosomal protein L18e